MSQISLDRNNKKALAAAIIASGTDDLNVMFLAFSMSSIITELGITGAQGGWIATVTNLGMLLGGLIFGLLADKYHKFKVFKWTIVVFSIATGLIYFTKSIDYLYLMRFLAGIGVGGEYGVAIAIIAGIVPAQKMGRMSSLNGIAGQLGSISSALLAGWLAPSLGWRGLFLFGLAPILLVLWMTFTIDDEKIWDKGGDDREESSQPVKINQLFKSPHLAGQTLALMVMTTVQIAGYFGMMNWLPTIIQTSLGISVKDSSLWMVATILGMCLGMLTFGHILDKFGPRPVYSAFLIASSVCVYLFQFANSMPAMIIGGAVVGFFVNGMFAGYGAMITRLYPHHIRSTANNLILNVGRAIGGFSSVIIGKILDVSGVPMVMIFLASLYIISFVAMLSIKNLRPILYQQLSN
ncbi:MFS transporter [Streptococcus pseudoporcinus]|uniref:Transporter, major facilitator family protein n=1 Tax=Streptococcus pseudoporcinus LQ 940-04 TaxID=875093 RepID=G5KAY1_9STRE|nr:MFS transporter [Streptococcus pseudoporcinus]EFR43773.1 transporter, major facilitator family protein [Streptococcus pseudoporcinus SPIN 20026]EHI65200.1 transporter, major facilitator family protein [Streptococcus pseudoporcinus LQ 940-04]VEF93209.1 major facilitator transporter [Streptococcus pseudoporcinus]